MSHDGALSVTQPLQAHTSTSRLYNRLPVTAANSIVPSLPAFVFVWACTMWNTCAGMLCVWCVVRNRACDVHMNDVVALNLSESCCCGNWACAVCCGHVWVWTCGRARSHAYVHVVRITKSRTCVFVCLSWSLPLSCKNLSQTSFAEHVVCAIVCGGAACVAENFYENFFGKKYHRICYFCCLFYITTSPGKLGKLVITEICAPKLMYNTHIHTSCPQLPKQTVHRSK